MTAQIIRFPYRPRLIGRDTAPAEDLERALRLSAERCIRLKPGARDHGEGVERPSDSE